MELYQHWEEATEETNEDSAQLRRDFKYHSRTSYHSLRHFTKVLAVGGCFGPVNQRDQLVAWLSAHQSELPSEIEDEQGNQGSGSRLEHSGTDYEQKLVDLEELTPENGLYALDCNVCNQLLDYYGKADPEYRQQGPTVRVWIRLMRRRGDAFARYQTEKAARLRWRGCEEFRGVTKALAYMDANVSPRAAQSGSAPLPTQAELHQLFNYDGLTLTWAVSRGRIRKGKPVQPRVKINGTNYYAGRLVWMHRTGEDPASATISHVDGDSTNLAWSNLRIERLATKSTSSGVRERSRQLSDSHWRARFEIDNKEYSLGEYVTQTQAEQAYELAMRTFQRFA